MGRFVFNCKKFAIIYWTTLTIVMTIGVFIYVLNDKKLAEMIQEIFPNISSDEVNVNIIDLNTLVLITANIFLLSSIFVSSLGLFGAMKENFSLSLLYLVLIIMDFIPKFIFAIMEKLFLIPILVYLFIIIIMVSFVIDLRRMNNGNNSISSLA
ncbi:hypothetical protein DERF_008499 [Dermatophagoides farinae]|uniref:Uncharacterized protein n=1 Tax=Dermatophagoides farinae TaxID=6954 RepID=A0A922I0H7_DERFA|nr:hypothetical protein DERF_008499 [Dermatophagoides farinae]